MPASIVFLQQRRQHDALDALIVGIGRKKVNWILDADIRSFFDSVSHDGLVRFLRHRHSDERILRMIRNWLRAGVLEDGDRDGRRNTRAAGGDTVALAGQCLPALRP
jgi:retron-type reverse transcriptase